MRFTWIPFLLLLATPAWAGFSHLELGAANYAAKDGRASTRFAVLGAELRELVDRDGPEGTLYLNDIDESGLELAIRYAKLWLGDRHYFGVKVVALPGDYTQIPLPFVKTATLNNPSGEQLPNPQVRWMNEPFRQETHAQNEKIVRHLEDIAAHSESGLKIVSYYYHPNYPALDEIGRLVQRSQWVPTGKTGPDYVLPNGRAAISSGEVPRIYYLKTEPCRIHFDDKR